MNIDNDFLKELGKKLRVIRKQKRIPQKELADLMDVAPTQYGKVERGIAAPSLKTLIKAAHALEISLDEIVFGTQTNRKNIDDEIKDNNLVEKMNIINSLSNEDRFVAIQLLDLIVTKKKLKDIVKDVHTLHR
jgi:transcriptional regulator with XRE-family HTH domain